MQYVSIPQVTDENRDAALTLIEYYKAGAHIAQNKDRLLNNLLYKLGSVYRESKEEPFMFKMIFFDFLRQISDMPEIKKVNARLVPMIFAMYEFFDEIANDDVVVNAIEAMNMRYPGSGKEYYEYENRNLDRLLKKSFREFYDRDTTQKNEEHDINKVEKKIEEFEVAFGIAEAPDFSRTELLEPAERSILIKSEDLKIPNLQKLNVPEGKSVKVTINRKNVKTMVSKVTRKKGNKSKRSKAA